MPSAPRLRRIVFGEPKPGFAPFGALLASGLAESVSYCNRSGPLQHDRVTDVPFTVPALGFGFVHPTALSFVRADPAPNDALGIFAWHHVQLYLKGIEADAAADPVHVEAARLCAAIYEAPGAPPEPWAARVDTAGVSWAVKRDGNRVYVVFRGSDTLFDWLKDVTALDPARVLAHDVFGRMWGGFLIGMADAWGAIAHQLGWYDGADEIVFTGHSLGAAHADAACGYAIAARMAQAA